MAALSNSPAPAPHFARSEPPTHGLVLDPGQIAAYRDSLIRPTGVQEPTVLAINLEGRFPLAEVLHELVVPLAQAARSGSLGPVMLVFCTPSAQVRDTLEALAEKHKLPLFIAPSAERIADAVPIGDLTATERETLEIVRRLGGSVNVAAFAKATGLAAPAATNRLVNVMQKGFMQRADRPRNEGVVYMDPRAVRVDATPPQLPAPLAREVEIFAAVTARSSEEMLATAWIEWVAAGSPDELSQQALVQAWLAYRQHNRGVISDRLSRAQELLSDPQQAAIQASGMSDEELHTIREAFE